MICKWFGNKWFGNKWFKKKTLLYLWAFSLSNPILAQSVTLADFESGVIPQVNPNQPDDSIRYLWNQYEGDWNGGPDPGSEEIVNEQAKSGQRSLKITVTAGDAYLQIYPYTRSSWQYAREYIESGTWQFDTYNRLRFWAKVPPGYTQRTDGTQNSHFGTYARKSNGDTSSAEDGGGHFYHYLNIPYTGEWHQVIIDWHPDHERGDNGGTEQGEKQYVSGENGFNYFDALTRFYFDGTARLSAFPAVFYFDNFEFYRDTNPENVQQVYGLTGVYVPNTNEINVSWRRPKNENAVKHEVRYSFTDIHASGWSSATPAPNGLITPLGWEGYNGMLYSSRDIDLVNNVRVFIGIKPENSQLFRQIELPIRDFSRPRSPVLTVE